MMPGRLTKLKKDTETIDNFRTNMFFPESSLWTRQKINDNLIQKNGGNIDFAVESDQRTTEKISHMGIEAELSMDFMSIKLKTKCA